MRLETDRLVLRPWQDTDRPQLAAILGDAEVRRFYPKVLTPEDTNQLMDQAIARAREDGSAFSRPS